MSGGILRRKSARIAPSMPDDSMADKPTKVFLDVIRAGKHPGAPVIPRIRRKSSMARIRVRTQRRKQWQYCHIDASAASRR
jgi:S-adenosylmethionine:diacylglycerol 3-amino-3-carboxypropyl transferase